MQILAILFLGVFALGMGACVIHLSRKNRELEEKYFFLERDYESSQRSLNAVRDENDQVYIEKRRLIKLIRSRTTERDDAHKMLEMVLNRDLENNQGFEQVRVELSDVTLNYQFNNKDDELGVVEVSRSGVLYLFDKAERINYEGNRRADSKSSVASGDSSEQEAEVRPLVQDGQPLYFVE